MSDNLDFFDFQEILPKNEDSLSISALNEFNEIEPFLGNQFTECNSSVEEMYNNSLFLGNSNPKKDLFITVRCSNKLVGRKRKDENHQIFDGSTHSKFSTDNMLTKIQVNFFSFLVDFTNDIIRQLGFNKKFLNLNHSFIKKVNKKYLDFFKGLNIGQVLCLGISPKYKNKEFNNIIIFNNVIKDPVINTFLSENYLTIFKEVYIKNEKRINMDKYGLNKIFELSKNVKTYKDFIEKMKNRYGDGTDDCNKYINSLNYVVNSKFLEKDNNTN